MYSIHPNSTNLSLFLSRLLPHWLHPWKNSLLCPSPSLFAGFHFSAPSVNITHNTAHLAPSSHLHGHFAKTWNKLWSPSLRSEEASLATTLTTKAAWTLGSHPANEWILNGWAGRQSPVGRRCFTNLGQNTVSCSPTSPVATGGLKQPWETVTLYKQETERGSEMVSCSLILLSVFYVCTCECCDLEYWKLNSKSGLLSGAKYSCTRPPREAKSHSNDIDADMVIKLWLKDCKYKAVCAGVWRCAKALERSH